MNNRFQGRSAIVTGAASGIGYAITTRLLDEGANVVAGDLNPAGVPRDPLAFRWTCRTRIRSRRWSSVA